MEIVLQKEIDDKSWKYLTGWAESVFPEEGKGMEWAPLGWHVLAIEGGQPIAHIGFDRFSLNDSDKIIKVIGVGAVVVRPEFQKRGIPAALFKELHEHGPQKVSSETFTLFCPERLVPYYRKHGYEKVNRAIKIMQFGKAIITRFEFMSRGNDIHTIGQQIVLDGPPW